MKRTDSQDAADDDQKVPVLPAEWRVYGTWTSRPEEAGACCFDDDGAASVLTVGETRYRPRGIRADGDRLDLGTYFGGFSPYDTAVLSTVLEAQAPTRLRIGAGADWWMEWRVNGRTVFDTLPEGNGAEPVRRDEHVFDLPLRAGPNRIAVRVIAGRAGFELAFCGPEQAANKPIFDFDDARVASLAERLDADAGLRATTVTERAWWDPLAKTDPGRAHIAAGRQVMREPMPAYPHAEYDAYFGSGSREAFQTVDWDRWHRLDSLVVAAVLSADADLVRAAEATLLELSREPDWSPPWGYRQGREGPPAEPIIELVSAHKAATLAEAVALLAPMLEAETVEAVRSAVSRRVAAPMADFIRSPDRELLRTTFWWARARTNWNAVCTEGSVTAILATVDDPRDRARALLAARENAGRYLEGFSEDGYTSEGIGYWNYGFGHFLFLNELARRQTDGRIGLFEHPGAGAAARFPLRLAISPGLYPAFSDVPVGKTPNPLRVEMARARAERREGPVMSAGFALESVCGLREFFAFLRPGIVRPPGGDAGQPKGECAADDALPNRDFFAAAEVLIARPAPGGSVGGELGLALKVGHNEELHNHNDVGSYVVAVGSEALLLDPGSPAYSSAVFDPKTRYDFRLLNSYGHSVPVVDGALQGVRRQSASGRSQDECADGRPRILETQFGTETDIVRADLRPAYDCAHLERLERTWRFERPGAGELMVEDAFGFSEAGAFETALVGVRFARLGSGRFCVVGEETAVSIEIEADFEWEHELVRIQNPGRPEPWRLGIRAKEERRKGTVRIRIRPLSVDLAREAETLEFRWLDSRMSGPNAGG